MNRLDAPSRWLGLMVLALCLALPAELLAQRTSSGSRTSTRSSRSSGSSSRSSSSSYTPNGQIGEAMISSDPETRRIIVITDDETSQSIGQVITNLDKPKPQVLIKVVFMELSYTKGSDVGLDASISKNLGGATIGSASNMFSSAALGSAGLPTAAGGMYQVLGNDFQATLRAIAEAGNTEILSKPSIMARNNQQAVIKVGQRVPIITGSQVNALTGGVNNTIQYQDVGIILTVTPFITSDGMVEMIVAPEISSLSSESVSVNTGTNAAYSAPIINNRSAETVVVTPDGKTVIIGGLMENKKLDTTRKIPLLGDIPGLGLLFQRKVKQNIKTELVIFLTPHIIPMPSQLAALTDEERSKSMLAPNAFKDKELDQFLETIPMRQEGQPADSKKSRKKSSSSSSK